MRPFPGPRAAVALLIALTVSSSALVAPTALGADPDDPGGPRDPGRRLHAMPAPGLPDGTVLGSGRPQTSDGVVGLTAADLPTLFDGFRISSRRTRWQAAPGVVVTTWDERDARGPNRFSLLTVKWRAPGVSVDYGAAGSVRRGTSVTNIARREHAVAAVNGDFFDIGDTGAPIGQGLDRQRGLVHGRATGWNSAFYFGHSGFPDIAPLGLEGAVSNRSVPITSQNSFDVEPGGIGLYTPRWGYTVGDRVTGGSSRNVRAVWIREGRVVRNSNRLPDGTPVTGRLLIGRDQGARQLFGLKVGQRVNLRARLHGQPRMAITGNQFLVSDGIIRVIDDREMHPRTAVGIDRETQTLLFLTVDGRQSFSRGYTMVELANKMIDLGADAALNLDGGGSSTMVARRPQRGLQVVTSPSEGYQRPVRNGVVVQYTRPRGQRQARG